MAVQKTRTNAPASSVGTVLMPRDELEELLARLKKTESSLSAMRSEFNQVLQNDGHGIRIINKNHTIDFVNRTFANLSGVQPEEAIGKKCWEVFLSPFCHTPECRLKRILDGDKQIQTEIERVKPDGQTIPCLVNAIPLLDHGGKPIGVIEIFTDIMEKVELKRQVKETEGRYRSLIELGTEAGEAVVMLQDIDGKEGVQTFISDAWIKITGFSRDELIGTQFFDLLRADDRSSSLARHRLKMSGVAVPGLYEMDIIRKDGTLVPVEITGAFTDYRGKRANVVYIREISERKYFEAQLRDYQRNLEQKVYQRTEELRKLNNVLTQQIDETRRAEQRFLDLFNEMPIALAELDWSGIKKASDILREKGVKDFRAHFNNHEDDYQECASHMYAAGITNKAYSHLWGARGSILSDEETKDVIHEISSGGTQHVVREQVIAVAEGKTEGGNEWTLRTIDGKRKDVFLRFYVPPEHETDYSVIYEYIFDLTTQKELERKISQLLEAEKTLRSDLGVCPSNNRALNRLQFTRVFTGVRCSLTHK